MKYIFLIILLNVIIYAKAQQDITRNITLFKKLNVKSLKSNLNKRYDYLYPSSNLAILEDNIGKTPSKEFYHFNSMNLIDSIVFEGSYLLYRGKGQPFNETFYRYTSTFNYTFNEQNNLISSTETVTPNNITFKIYNFYNSENLLDSTTTLSNENKTEYGSYTSDSFRIMSTHKYYYDSLSNLIKQINYENPFFLNVNALKKNTTQYFEYDSRGLVKLIRNVYVDNSVLEEKIKYKYYK